MVQIEWSVEAEQRLADIHDYIAQDNPLAAERTVRGILARIDQLQRFPELGPAVPGYKDRRLRQLVYGHYRVLYEYHGGEAVYIAGIFHGAMDFKRYL